MSEPTPNSRVCVRGGFLVGPTARLPDDPRYFQTPGAEFIVGCNRFQCRLCGKMVRQQVGLRDADAETASKNAGEIYNTPDLGQSTYLVADTDSRVYVCGCTLVILTGSKSSPFPNGNWGCAGHPPMDDGNVLPPMTTKAANSFCLLVANSQLQQTVNLVGITFTDGNGLLGRPANISLGGAPALKLWTNETTTMPIELDFAKIAGGCVQLTDNSISAF